MAPCPSGRQVTVESLTAAINPLAVFQDTIRLKTLTQIQIQSPMTQMTLEGMAPSPYNTLVTLAFISTHTRAKIPSCHSVTQACDIGHSCMSPTLLVVTRGLSAPPKKIHCVWLSPTGFFVIWGLLSNYPRNHSTISLKLGPGCPHAHRRIMYGSIIR